jgi:hypothetical protein
VSERSRASTPSPWRRPGPSVMPPAAESLLPTTTAAPAGPESAPPEPEGRKPPRGRRRLIRWVAIIAGVILAVLACWQDPLYAL